MTITHPATGSGSIPAAQALPAELVTCSIDGITISAPKGTLIIRAAEQLGIEIPRFCDHPLLDPVAACRMCLVEIEGQAKPQPACAMAIGDGMDVRTQLTSEVADQAQKGVMEFLLINHPLDCPICDKGGECPLQNQAMTHGHGESRFRGVKRTFPKPVAISTEILLDRERCISCTRCTRFADQIAGDPFIELFERGAQQQVAVAGDTPFDSYFSGNTVQICPVGALTSTGYRFRSRPFDLVSAPSVCEHCACGCALRTDHRRFKVMRRLAWDDPQVNEEWNCDKGRFAFEYLSGDRLETPLIRDGDGNLQPADWPRALELVAQRLAAASGKVGVIPGGRLTREDAYAYAKFARLALGTDNIDFRTRPTSAEEAEFIAAAVAGTGLGISYADLERAPVVLTVALEPEEEAPIVFLRLRKAARDRGTRVAAIAPWASPGLAKSASTVLAARPGGEPGVLDALRTQQADLGPGAAEVSRLLTEPGAVILVGERLALVRGGLSAASALAAATGARLAWIPRRAGERGAADAGALTGLLPGGRPLAQAAARAQVATAWGVATHQLPSEPGLDLAGMAEAAVAHLQPSEQPEPAPASAEAVAQPEADRESEVGAEPVEPAITAFVVGGMDPADLADPAAFVAALDAAEFVVSLETRRSEVTEHADVVLPVAVDTERAGSYVNWEGRARWFNQLHKEIYHLTDGRVLALIAQELDVPIGQGDPASLHAELQALGSWPGERPRAGEFTATVSPQPGAREAVLATWRQLLDLGALQADEPYLAGTRRPAVARMSPETAAAIGADDGGPVTVSTDQGSVTLPLAVTAMADGVVWIPANSPGSTVQRTLGVLAGAIVGIAEGVGG